MEKKTLGTFLAALRKSNGMTQKQLAEKLNVSDKAVSRWERDECAPDLAFIPVIAEIFGITADELLRGERRKPDVPQSPQEDKRTEKQLRYLLNDAKSRLRVRLLLSVTVAVLGLLAAMICNLGFLRAYLGFFLGTAFYVVAAVMAAVFLIYGYSAVNNSDFGGSAMEEYRRFLIKTATLSFSVIGILFAAVLPLIIFPWDPYLGLDGEDWLTYGLIYGIVAAAVCVLTSWVLHSRLIRSGFLSGSPADEKRSALRKKILRATIIILCVTFTFHWGFNIFTSASTFAPGTTFNDWEDFKAFMETPADYDGYSMQAVSGSVSDVSDMVFITENGSFIYPEEVLIETVRNQHGTILCSYKNLNLNVVDICYGPEEDGLLPVTVYTNSQRIQGANIRNNINTAFFLLYIAECIGLVVCYLRKNKMIR